MATVYLTTVYFGRAKQNVTRAEQNVTLLLYGKAFKINKNMEF